MQNINKRVALECLSSKIKKKELLWIQKKVQLILHTEEKFNSIKAFHKQIIKIQETQ